MRISEQQNLTVVLRVRPLSEPHVGKDRIVHVLDGQMVILTDPRDEDDILRAKRSREKRYMFDIAFDSYITQLDVYMATAKPLIDSVLEGFNATVFAYGPTGTGKTYTMLGTDDNPGIMALALNEIFALIRKGGEHNTFTVTLSYLEVYNELIRDLLCPDTGDLEMREDGAGVTVAGLTEVEARSTHEVMALLRDGNKRRTTEPTSVNKTSSRSHAVLQVTVKRLKRVRSLTETIHVGKLYMIDLAGSERATATKNRGTRLVEGAHINRSLLALGNCIKALSNNPTAYVNYRDSKLTRLLKDSLGGNCLTVMIAHVSPDWSVFDESRNTLQYADRAKRIKTKVRPNLQTVSHHIAKYPIIVEELHKEIARLKKEASGGHSMESSSGMISAKEREAMEQKRAELTRIYHRQLKFKTRLKKLEGTKKIGEVNTERLTCMLNQHNLSTSLYSVLPSIQSPDAAEAKGAELKTALRHMSAGKKRSGSIETRLMASYNKLADKYLAVEQAIDEKITDGDQRELLSMLANIHNLELQLAGRDHESKYLQTILEEQEGWSRAQASYNLQLLHIVRSQHQLLTENSIQLTPELSELYRSVEEHNISEYSVLPRIGSALSSAGGGDETVSAESTPPASPDSTPVFMKTYNVVNKEDEKDGHMDREMSQTTIHVLSTPSLTGDNSPQSPSLSSLTLPTKGSSSSELLLTPVQTAQSSQLPVKQTKKGGLKAIQLQRLRTLRTEPGMKHSPSKLPMKNQVPKNHSTRTLNKNQQVKSDIPVVQPTSRVRATWANKRVENLKNFGVTFVSESNLRMAEKARIYGGPDARPSRDKGYSKRRGGPGRKRQGGGHATSQIQLSVSGTNKNFPTRVFR